ncbi:MAG: aminopeptidase N [Gammaproteobacteria bacterium]
MRDANPQTVYLKDYTPPDYLIRQADLHFHLDAEQTRVVSLLTLVRNPQSAEQGTNLTLQGEDLQLTRLVLNGTVLGPEHYYLGNDYLTVYNVPQQQVFELEIENCINPGANTALEGLYLSNGMLCTQCEAQGFRKITYFLDRPDVMARFTTTLHADKQRYPVLLSNGNRIAAGEAEGNRHWVKWEDPFAKPCYLFALVAGQLHCIEDRYTTLSGRDIALQIFVEAHDVDKCSHALQSLKNAMRWDEEVYGREYDLDLYMIVAVSHFNMGAMENKGLNVFNTKFVLARPDTATDADYEHIEGVIGHEYFHNWTGNRITCRDWFQLSLKEGLTVFRDQQFSGDRTSHAVKRIEDVNMLRTRQFAEDAGPLAHPVRPDSYIEINNFYTLTVYEKGAEVVRMLHTLLGADGFRKGMNLYFARHDGQAVTCDDFVAALEAANHADLGQFRRWYTQAGTPVLHVEQHYDSSKQTLALTLRQSCPPTPGQAHKEALHIPVKIGLIGPDGMPLPLHVNGNSDASVESVLELKESQQTFYFERLPAKPVVSLLRGFSAPVKLDMPRNLQESAFLLQFDSDPFNRWEAGQQLAGSIILNIVAALQQGREVHVDPILPDAFGYLLAQPWEDLSYFALLTGLPSEAYLAEQMPVIDVEAIHNAWEAVRKTLAERLQPAFEQLYRRYHRDESGQFDAGAIGRRRVKNRCLGYLSALENAEVYELAERQFSTARNMTDQIAALSAVVNSRHPHKERCLQDFYRQWQNEALVIDKWFALQAGSVMPDAFERVQALLTHPAFDMRNPNRVRALIGAFSQNNPLHFHAANGQGYRFLAEQVKILNRLNPQVAARMLSPLTQWRRYDPERQALIQAQLQSIVAEPNISRDVYEVASKALS